MAGGDAVSDRVRRSLVETLYTQPLSMALGALCGITAAGTSAWVSGERDLWVAATLLTLIAAIRISMAVWLSKRPDPTKARRDELLYEVGAFSYSITLGMIAGMTFLYHVPSSLQTLMAVNAVGYGAGICARNAGRPAIAIGQLLLTNLPVIVALIAVGSLPFYALTLTIVLLLPAMISICLKLFALLRRSVEAAETSADLAQKMQKFARTDVVTNLANRAGLNHDLAAMLTVLPADRKLALCWIDLDRFKEVNDILGHQVGDKVLAEVAARLAAQAPPGATVARFGGDEFIIAAEVPGRAESEELARTLLEDVTRPIRIEGERLAIGASMGIGLMPDDGADLDTLMQSADLALYHAKTNGRNQLRFFDPAMTRDLVRRKEIEAELRLAIQRDELSIFFQPIVDLDTGKIRTFEALVRWFHPIKGELRPDEFIPVAEETGVIITLGNWITAQAARVAATWPEEVTIAVNLSPLQIKAPGAALGILNAIKDARLDPRRLELEVTESLFLDENENTARFIDELSSHGIRFALDDFGTGYSSLGYINKFPFKKIKVDRSFVSGSNVGKKSDAIIRAVAEMGNRLEMDIVAEGLETIEQVRAVREAGCTLGQGYYFSRAVPDYLAAMLLAQERDEGAPDQLVC
jgi:diguanylate cyclase (GGDEF)-like protein